MSESDFLIDLRRDYGKLQPSVRKQKIRKLAAESLENKKFIMKVFPEFYAEAFPSRARAAGRPWGSSRVPGYPQSIARLQSQSF